MQISPPFFLKKKIAFFIDHSNIDVINHNCKTSEVHVCLCPLVFRNYNTLFVSVSVEGMHFDTCVIMLAGTLNFALTENKLFFLNVCVYIYIYTILASVTF